MRREKYQEDLRRLKYMSNDNWDAEVRWVSDSVFLGSDEKGHSIVYDSEQDGKGISPMRSLLTALGACSAMDVVALLKKKKHVLRALRVLLKGERPQYGYPKPYTSIEVKYLVTGDLEPNVVEEVIKESMEKFCSVAATFGPRVKITYSYEISR